MTFYNIVAWGTVVGFVVWVGLLVYIVREWRRLRKGQ